MSEISKSIPLLVKQDAINKTRRAIEEAHDSASLLNAIPNNVQVKNLYPALTEEQAEALAEELWEAFA